MVSQRALRVFQVATGNVGSEMVGRIVEHPDLELVGLYCYSSEKVGRDAGEVVGIKPSGSAQPVTWPMCSKRSPTS
jgi:4-hydroxy-tetrahydrodipicolinate reductase